MTDALRKKLERRTKLWNTKQRPPSEIKSERLRKKLSRGQPVSVVRQTDCRGCSKYPCGATLEVCGEESRAERCAQCGVKVLYRYIASEIYYCPICVSRRRWLIRILNWWYGHRARRKARYVLKREPGLYSYNQKRFRNLCSFLSYIKRNLGIRGSCEWHRILCAPEQGVIIEYHITRRKIHTDLGIAQSVNTKLKQGYENQNSATPRKLRTRLWLRWLSERF